MPWMKKQCATRLVSLETTLQKSNGWLGRTAMAIMFALLLQPVLFAETQTGKNGASSVSSLQANQKTLAEYAGSESCRACHQTEYELWRHSHHGLAERLLESKLDRPAFDPPRKFNFGAQGSGASFDGTNYFITCVDLSRTNVAHRVIRVIGDDPLREFLTPFPGGRLQVLEDAYDPHRNQWFDVFGNENRQPGEWGHWTGRGMNWNSMCAACHNTRLRKNYDEATDTYHTDDGRNVRWLRSRVTGR